MIYIKNCMRISGKKDIVFKELTATRALIQRKISNVYKH